MAKVCIINVSYDSVESDGEETLWCTILFACCTIGVV